MTPCTYIFPRTTPGTDIGCSDHGAIEPPTNSGSDNLRLDHTLAESGMKLKPNNNTVAPSEKQNRRTHSPHPPRQIQLGMCCRCPFHCSKLMCRNIRMRHWNIGVGMESGMTNMPSQPSHCCRCRCRLRRRSFPSHHHYCLHRHYLHHRDHDQHNTPTPFDSIPQEVLESIMFFIVASEWFGPPRELFTLMLVNKHMYTLLSCTTNLSFHLHIFVTKFDTGTLPAASPVGCESRCSWVAWLVDFEACCVLHVPLPRSALSASLLGSKLWSAVLRFSG